jgi:3-hydroxyacyl-CoA dehydrogenase
MTIKNIAVIGAGVMGSGIAAQFANAGYKVTLLDIAAKGSNRNAIAEGAIKKMLKTEPAPLMHKRFARNITPGNLDDHMDLLKDADWIVEAIVENLEIKQKLYANIDAIRKDGSIVSSNTSTIPLHFLIEGMSDRFQKDFMITHFFNPPRYMRLVEVVTHAKNDQQQVANLKEFCDRKLGKTPVSCHDTPGFIANRIGIYWIQLAATAALEYDLTVEEVDALMGRPIGVPKTGVFALMDLVGLDLMPPILSSMKSHLPKDDPFMQLPDVPAYVTKMIADGYTGRKGKGGFYRLNKAGGKKVKESLNLKTEEYTPSSKPKLSATKKARDGIRFMLMTDDKYGRYAKHVMLNTLRYAAMMVPETTDTIHAVDEAMRLGFNWKFGPFELMDKVGPKWIREELQKAGQSVPPLLEKVGDGTFYKIENGELNYLTTDGKYTQVTRPDGVLLLSDIKRKSTPLAKNDSASLWDIGDGIVCLEFTSKMNSLDQASFELMMETIEIVNKGYKGLVVYNESSHFSAGANIGMALFAAQAAMWPMIEEFVAKGQQVYKALKYAPFPVIGAPSGIAVGGGCEILLHCDSIQAHSESYIGLVEVGVGLVPAWGGCKEMLYRWINNKKAPKGPMPAPGKVFEIVGTAHVAKSAFEAKECLFLREHDEITMNRDRLLFDAKQKALKLAENYTIPETQEIVLPGATGKTTLEWAVSDLHKSGKATDYDVVVTTHLAGVLSGGDTDITETVTEDDILKLELDTFMPLVKNDKTLARIQHMLETGKPLRN